MSTEKTLELVQSQVNEIKTQLSRVESTLLGLRTTPPSTEKEIPQQPFAKPTPKIEVAAMPQQMASKAPHLPSAPGKSFSTTFLGIVGVLCILLGGAFLIRLAINEGWLTPARQWGAIFITSFGLMGVALYLRKLDQAYAGLLAGAGVVMGYFASYSGTAIFGLFPSEISLILAVGVSVCSILLHVQFKHEFFSVIAVMGTYLTPPLLGFSGASQEFLIGYFLLWTAAFSFLAYKLNSIATLLSLGYFSVGIFSLVADLTSQPFHAGTILTVQTIQVASVIASLSMMAKQNERRLSQLEAWLFFPLLLFFYGIQYKYVAVLNSELAPWIALGMSAAIYIAHYLVTQNFNEKVLHSTRVVNSFLALVIFHAGYLKICLEYFSNYLFLLAPLGLSLFYLNQLRSTPFKLHLTFKIVAIGVFGIELLRQFFDILLRGPTADLKVVIATYFNIVTTLAILRLLKAKKIMDFDSYQALLFVVHFITAVVMFRTIDAEHSIVITTALGGYGVALLIVGFVAKDIQFAKSSAAVLVFVGIKALLFDSSGAHDLVRVLCLMLTGGLLYGAGFFLRKVEQIIGQK
jgi:uncharacterized membrane protein